MTTKHTSGPWTAINIAGEGIRISDARDYTIAVILGASLADPFSQDPANARLITAALDMFEALQLVANCITAPDASATLGAFEIQKIAAALAKATGEE